MSKKSNLLSIGETSKISGASIRSLRYYEQMGLLKPAYTDPDSGYRYYSFDQLHSIIVIMFCIELGIPLKDLNTGTGDTIYLRAFLEQGKAIAKNKLKSLEKGLKLFEVIERQMDLSEMHPKGQVYHREIEEKIFYVHHFGRHIEEMNQLEIAKALMALPLPDEVFDGLSEYGFMCEYTALGTEYYVFVEIPAHMKGANTRIIPPGNYFCCLNENGQITNTTEIFKKQLTGVSSFLAIETEIMANKHELNKPFISELRFIALQHDSGVL